MQILLIGLVWPEPASSAAGSRIIKLIDLFLSKGWEVTFSSAAAKSEFSADLISKGVNEISIELNSSSFYELAQGNESTKMKQNCPNAIRILDTEDLHFLRNARHLVIKENRKLKESDLKNDAAKREIASILRCDLSLIISIYEMNLLEESFKIDSSIIHYLPFSFSPITKKNTESWKSFDERVDFVSIGNFLHPPNADIVKQLKTIIWPLIRKQLPNANLNIYGSYISQQYMEMHDEKTGFIVHGRAKNALEVLGNARVCLAPIRFGAGLKGTLAEAMFVGTPSVTTSVGAEAMHTNLEWNGYIKDEPEEFAEAAVKLYSEKAKWQKAQENGITIINQLFSTGEEETLFISRIYNLMEHLESHRLNNFLGSILMQNSSNALKYMSRWIEEKNKK